MGFRGKFLRSFRRYSWASAALVAFATCSATPATAADPATHPPAADKNTSASRPNIIVILSDDMGFSDIGAMGGEINTPTLDNMAANGKIFTQFYNTPRCCPSRASLLTGLYSHQAGIGHLIYKTPHIGYGDYLTSDSITIAEVLKDAGYGTYITGKWHLAPRTYNPKTDIQYWPTRRGFDKFYGTINGSNSFWDPSTLVRGEKYISAFADPEYKPEQYYYTDAITDNAVKFLKEHEQEKKDQPFFMYVAYTAAHWPLHAPEEAIAPYRGKYDAGYKAIHDARMERLRKKGFLPHVGDTAPVVGNWDEVQDKKLEAALMETYAAMVSRMDQGIGKIIEQLRAEGQLDNTLILYMQDNGACAEDPYARSRPKRDPVPPMPPEEIQMHSQPQYTRDGTPIRTGHDVYPGPPETLTAYRENWANVSNTPFRLYKHFVHEGGISTPLIAYWPAAIKPTSSTHLIRTPAHLIDIMPTLLELAGTKYPETHKGVKLQPQQGVSLVSALTGSGDIKRDEPLFWEHEGNRAVRDGKWKITAISERGQWELYDMENDRGETHDLAKEHPGIVKKMAAQWDAWAARSRVLPLGGWRDRISTKKAAKPAKGKKKVSLKQGDILPAEKSLDLKNHGIQVTAEIVKGPVEGVVVAQGASFNGFSIYGKDDRIYFVATMGKKQYETSISAFDSMPIEVTARLDTSGVATLVIGHNVDTAKIAEESATTPDNASDTWNKASSRSTRNGAGWFAHYLASSNFGGVFPENPTQGISAGLDSETPVGNYPRQFKFKGEIGSVKGHILTK